jgi:hypothetical protein
MSIASRVKRLERRRGIGTCNGQPTVMVMGDDPVSPNAPRCRGCGQCHVLRVKLVLAKSRQTQEALT